MNRTQKEAEVSHLREGLSESAATFVVNYQGLDVASMQGLRETLRESGGRVRVSKARLMKIAAQELEGGTDFAGSLQDQIGLVFATDIQKVTDIAKKLIDYSKENEKLDVISGFYESQVMTKDQVKFFASLPSREVLLATVAGTLNAPVTSFVRVLNLLIVRLLYVLQRVAEQKQAGA